MQSLVPTAHAAQQLDDPESTEDLAPGACAGPWVVERELGRGGMGTVYAVVHEGIGKRAALKIMHRSCAVERILLEAKVVNQVGHPNIVDIFETGVLTDGRPYIVMERLDGVSLALRAEDGKLLPDLVIAILLQICDALIAAHAAGIVHRDLKLDNVFLIDNPAAPDVPRVKLLDWGIAKVMSCAPHTTVVGQLVGTPQYLSPEQARGGAVSPATDVYSLGVMAFELFLEQLPFEAETSAEVMVMHLHATPPRPSELWPDIPGELEALLLAMLAKDPDARPTMLGVAHALERVAIEIAQRCTPAIPPEPPRCERWLSAPRSVPEAPDTLGWTTPSRRWPLWLGAVAFAASAAFYSVARDPDSAAATALLPPPAPSVAAPARVVEPARPSPSHAIARAPVHATAVVAAAKPKQVTQVAQVTPAVTAPRPAPMIAPKPAPSVRHALAAPVAHHRPVADVPAPVKSSPAPVPRSARRLDANGTLDPYR